MPAVLKRGLPLARGLPLFQVSPQVFIILLKMLSMARSAPPGRGNPATSSWYLVECLIALMFPRSVCPCMCVWPWQRSSTCLYGLAVSSCTQAEVSLSYPEEPPSDKTSLRDTCGKVNILRNPFRNIMTVVKYSRLPLPGGMAAHWCLRSRAHAVCNTGSTKMSALLSLRMFSTSYTHDMHKLKLDYMVGEDFRWFYGRIWDDAPFYRPRFWAWADSVWDIPPPDLSVPGPLPPLHTAEGSETQTQDIIPCGATYNYGDIRRNLEE